MNTSAKSNNDRLRELVRNAGLTQAAALEIFNRDLGPGAYKLDTWRGYFVAPGSKRYRPLKDDLLEHAKKVLGPLAKKA